MKECFKCKCLKPLSEFYRHSKMADGHLNKCKSCTKNDTRENRLNNSEYYLVYDRNRPNKEERVKRVCERTSKMMKADPEFREKVFAAKKQWQERNPLKRKAQNTANNAVRDGKLERKTACEHCGACTKLQKHHWSYDEAHWLDVVWLCTKCHGKEHVRLNEIGRDPDRVAD